MVWIGAFVSGSFPVALTSAPSGNVAWAGISHSTDEIFNEAALVAARKMKFKPARVGGKPVKVKVVIPFVFSLKERKRGGER